MSPGGPTPGFAPAGRDLAALWARGARVGESTACSLCVHMVSSAEPDEVAVVVDRDAGQLFYGRACPGEIVHLDVFHAPGGVPPPAVAQAFGRAARAYAASKGGPGPAPCPDWFDVQTALGGGRLSGDLTGGRRPSVQAAHRGHVHLAGRLGPEDAAFCFHLVTEVERAVAALGLEPRKPLRVLAVAAGPGAGGGLEDYAALTDSWLRGPRGPRPSPGPGSAAEGGGGAADRTGGRGGGRFVPGGGGGSGVPGGAGGGGTGSAAAAAVAAAASADVLIAAAARLADEGGGLAGVRALLDALASGAPGPGWPLARAAPPHARDGLARLVQEGWAEAAAGGGYRLTSRGHALRAAFATRFRDIELALRSAARRLTGPGSTGLRGGTGSPGGPRRRGGAALPERGQRLVDLAVPETAQAAAVRSLGSGERLRIRGADVRLRRRVRPRRVDLLLLLDASASMEGGRMRAAKALARHLLLTGRDRVAVMAFQERAAVLAVPMTRNFAAAERGLGQLAPAGLTPLAAGLAAARTYLARSHARNPLLLLVTDGIPTVAGRGSSPLEEALEEAGRLRGSGIALCCIGLEPNERYLAELARRAGGRLHVVSELRSEVLAAVARRERLRRMEG